MKYFVCSGLDSGIQLVLLIIESNHRLINRSVIWIVSRSWL